MKKSNYKSNICTINISKILFIALSLVITPTAIAGVSDITAENDTVYVDSVTQWGAWNLDIEPAAGGLTQAATQALNARDSSVSLRANSISALAQVAPPVPALKPPTPATPVTPVVPVTPVGPVGPANFAPPAATPATTIIVNLPPATNITPFVDSSAAPTGISGLF